MPEWKTVTAPRMLFLPVAGADFGTSGRKVFPHDEIEILPGTLKAKINGVEVQLQRTLEDLIDDDGVIQLAKPAPPVSLSRGGPGRAITGRLGEARSTRGLWDHDAADNWQGDAATTRFPSPNAGQGTDLFGRPDRHRGFKVVPEERPLPRRTASFEPTTPLPDRDWSPEEQAVIDEFHGQLQQEFADNDPDIEIREVRLRDGSIAHARFSKDTGRQIGATFRQYQEGTSFDTHGSNPSFDMDQYRRDLAEQNRHATPAPTARERYEQAQAKNAARTLHGAPPRPVPAPPTPTPPPTPTRQVKTASLGSPHLDNLVGAACSPPGRCDAPGVPLGLLLHLSGPQDAREALLRAAGATTAPTLEAAIGKMFMLTPDDPPLVAVELDTNDIVTLAAQLPAAATAFEESPRAALVVSTPDQGAKTPPLLDYIAKLKVRLTPHERDPRFITASCDKEQVSFPVPG